MTFGSRGFLWCNKPNQPSFFLGVQFPQTLGLHWTRVSDEHRLPRSREHRVWPPVWSQSWLQGDLIVPYDLCWHCKKHLTRRNVSVFDDLRLVHLRTWLNNLLNAPQNLRFSWFDFLMFVNLHTPLWRRTFCWLWPSFSSCCGCSWGPPLSGCCCRGWLLGSGLSLGCTSLKSATGSIPQWAF